MTAPLPPIEDETLQTPPDCHSAGGDPSSPSPDSQAGLDFEAVILRVRSAIARVHETRHACAADASATPVRLADAETDLGDAIATIERMREALTRERAALELEHSALSERTRRLTQLEVEYGQRDETLQAQLADLEPREVAARERRAAADKLYEQALEVNERSQRQHEQIVQLRKQLTEREAALNQYAVQLELERGRIETDRAALPSPLDPAELAGAARVEPIGDRRGAESPADAPGAIQPAAPPAASARARKGSRWGVSLALSVVAACTVGAAWLLLERPVHEVRVRLAFENDPPPSIATVSLHAGALGRADLISPRMDEATRTAWAGLIAARAIGATALPDGLVELSATGENAEGLRRVLGGVAEAYAQHLREENTTERLALLRAAWNARCDALRGELAAAETEWSDARARIPPAPTDTQTTGCDPYALRGEYDASLLETDAARQRLAQLQAAGPIVPFLSDDALDDALAKDAIYQEDLSELLSVWRDYRSDLTLAMVLVEDPSREMRSAVQALSTALNEQRDLQPPPPVRASLDHSVDEVETFNGALSAFLQEWPQRRSELERLEAGPEPDAVFAAREQASASAAALAEAADGLLAALGAAAEALTSSGDAGTRGSVVASLLRGEIGRLSTRVGELREALKGLSIDQNVKLDAHDRLMRSLHTRLGDRRQSLMRIARDQLEAFARGEYEQQLTSAADELAALEQRQAALLSNLLDAEQHARQTDEARQAHESAAAIAAGIEPRVQRLRAELDAALAAQPTARPDSLVVRGEDRIVRAGTLRERHALTASAIAFCFVLIATRATAGARSVHRAAA